MPSNTQPSNPLARLFKPDPHRELFRVLADSLDDAVFVLSPDGEAILTCNHAFLLLSGYARADLEAMPSADLLPGEPGERALASLVAAPDSTEVRLEQVPLKSHPGEVTPVDLQAFAVGSPRHALLVRARPSGLRLQTEERAQRREARLQTIVEMTAIMLDGSLPGLPAALNLARQLLGASVLGLYRVSPAEPDYVLDGPLPEAFPPNLAAAVLDPLHRPGLWSLGQRPEHPLHKAARAAGLNALRTCPVGSPSAWIGVLVAGWRETADLSDETAGWMQVVANLCHAAILLGLQHAAVADLQRDLYQLEAEVSSQFAAVSEAVLSLDGDLKVVRANPAAAQLLGYQPGELEGLPVQDVLVGPSDLLATLLDALGHQRKAEQAGLTLHHRDGRPFPAQLRAVPLSGAARSRLLVVVGDRSERQAAEDQTEVLAQRALLGEVSAIFAHEVRNPINNISTGVQLVASRLGEQHPLHDSLERIQKECVRLDQLMRDVLFFARPLELKMEPVDLAEMMKRLLERWKPRFNQNSVRCHTAFEPGTPRVSADPRTLEQVVVNLITNALQAMAAGGTLSVNLAPGAAAPEAMVELKIADTGPGIPPDVVERIFDPFFTTKKDGTGLGLAISRRILAAHKGGISVESYPDAGTVFTIRLPAVQAGEGDGR